MYNMLKSFFPLFFISSPVFACADSSGQKKFAKAAETPAADQTRAGEKMSPAQLGRQITDFSLLKKQESEEARRLGILI